MLHFELQLDQAQIDHALQLAAWVLLYLWWWKLRS